MEFLKLYFWELKPIKILTCDTTSKQSVSGSWFLKITSRVKFNEDRQDAYSSFPTIQPDYSDMTRKRVNNPIPTVQTNTKEITYKKKKNLRLLSCEAKYKTQFLLYIFPISVCSLINLIPLNKSLGNFYFNYNTFTSTISIN